MALEAAPVATGPGTDSRLDARTRPERRPCPWQLCSPQQGQLVQNHAWGRLRHLEQLRTQTSHYPQPNTNGHSPCLQPLAPPSLAREEGWRRKKRNLIAAEDQGERLLGRSLEKGRGKEITKKKEKINKNFTIWSQRVLIPSTKITQAALPNHPVHQGRC